MSKKKQSKEMWQPLIPAPRCKFKFPKSKFKSDVRAPKRGGEWPSIKAVLYYYFDRVGCDNAVYGTCLKLARIVRPTTKFNPWHMYYHRKIYRRVLVERAREDLARRRKT